MDKDTQNEMLIRIDANLKNLIQKFDQAAGEDGFNRCGVRGEKINQLEKEVSKHKDDHTWLWRTTAVTFLGLILKTLWDALLGS